MRNPAIVISLLMVVSGNGLAQELQLADTISIELTAAAYVAQSLPDGIIGFDGTAFDRQRRTTEREASRVDTLARVIGAIQVRTDSVFTCPGDPMTCRMRVDALVRVGTPYASPEGARVVVEVRRHSGTRRQPIHRVAQELILARTDGSWRVVGLGRVNAS